jgi:hypothetical protein
MLEINKRYTLEAPQGTISERGVQLIQSFIAAQRLQDENWKVKNPDVLRTYLNPLPDDWQWQWVVKGRGAYVGTFPKRVSKFYFQTDNIKTPNDFLQEIGNLARLHSEDNTVYHFEIVDNLDWKSGDFGDSGSCFWGSRNLARAIMRDNGGMAIRFYDDDNKGYARAWLAAIASGLYIVFNGYGFKSNPTLVIARVLASFAGLSYKKIALSNRGATNSTVWINSSIGYLIGSTDAIADYAEYDLKWDNIGGVTDDENEDDDDDTFICQHCGDEIDEDETYTTPHDEIFCQDCFYERYNYCDGCDDTCWRDEMYYIEREGIEICESCYERDYSRCDGCGDDYPHDEIANAEYNYYCDDCLPDHTTHCTTCHETVYRCHCRH